MRVRPPRLVRLAIAAVTILSLSAAPALAQEKEEKPFEEPGITYVERRGPYIEWIAGALIVIACLLVAFKNPHRTHLD